MTMRLALLVEKLISKTQKAFIQGGYILDGVVILHEVLHELKLRKIKGIILKLDFEKAYDKVRWSFMMDVLRKKNCPTKWID